jgi:hypothetical protein
MVWSTGRRGRAAAAFALTGASLLLAAGVEAQAPGRVSIPNPGFEEGGPGGPPAGWGGTVAPAEGTSGYRLVLDADRPYRGRASARIDQVGDENPAQPFGSLGTGIEAAPFRGRRIRLTAAVRTAVPAGSQVGLWLRVGRPGGQMGFFDNMADRPIRSPEWSDFTIEGDVARDAEGIALGMILVGAGSAWLDEVRVEEIGPAAAADPERSADAPGAPSAPPQAVLDAAIALLRQHHINSASADWDRIAAEARTRLAAQPSAQDAHAAVRYVIDALGERHTFLAPRPSQGTAGGPAREAPPMPTHAMVQERFGRVSLPQFGGTPEEAARYEAALREALISLDARGVCGWIVDLRGNGGGNMWPMLKGLDPLLGNGPFGTFRTPAGRLTHWVRKGGTILPDPAPGDAPPIFPLKSAAAPLAILIGPGTASSGEMVAIAFAGRPGVRSFGAPSAAYSTANSGYPLPDGSMLFITGAYARDRTDREYKGALTPDEPTELDAAEAAALRWLRSQPCP